MTIMIKPLHVGTVGGQPLRFFHPPKPGAGLAGPFAGNGQRPVRLAQTPVLERRLPWPSIEDLYRCLGLSREQRKIFLTKLRRWSEPQTIATDEGITTITPHFMAQGTIDMVVEAGMVPASIRSEYDRASRDAGLVLVGFAIARAMGWQESATTVRFLGEGFTVKDERSLSHLTEASRTKSHSDKWPQMEHRLRQGIPPG
jgi:hypothetical protein